MKNIKVGVIRNQSVRSFKQVEDFHRKYMQFLHRVPSQDRPLMKAAYYLYHLNHYAKAEGSHLYRMKYQVLSILHKMYKDTPYWIVQYVKGEDKVELCHECADDIKEERKRGLVRLFIHACVDCAVGKDYYSLLDIRVQYRGYKYHFHVPFDEIDKWFNIEIDTLPVIVRRKEKGNEKYGRVVTKEEKEFLPLDQVLRELEYFITKYENNLLKETHA